jgi:hypothetical protein
MNYDEKVTRDLVDALRYRVTDEGWLVTPDMAHDWATLVVSELRRSIPDDTGVINGQFVKLELFSPAQPKVGLFALYRIVPEAPDA